MIRIKICGITNPDDARLSVTLGADALGFNFYEKSPRYIAPGSARRIVEMIDGSAKAVGVFVNSSLDDVCRIARESNVGAIQLHGDESAAFVDELAARSGLEIIKAFRVENGAVPVDMANFHAEAILLDGYSQGTYGGSGKVADWEVAKKLADEYPKVYLAGGLTPENVADAIRTVRPFAVDVASGVELTKGKKDPAKLRAFVQNARNA